MGSKHSFSFYYESVDTAGSCVQGRCSPPAARAAASTAGDAQVGTMKRLAWIAARHHRPRAPIETVFAGVDPGADRAALALFSTLPCDVDLRFLHTSGSDEEPSAILPTKRSPHAAMVAIRRSTIRPDWASGPEHSSRNSKVGRQPLTGWIAGRRNPSEYRVLLHRSSTFVGKDRRRHGHSGIPPDPTIA